jgi:hypothetical protein
LRGALPRSRGIRLHNGIAFIIEPKHWWARCRPDRKFDNVDDAKAFARRLQMRAALEAAEQVRSPKWQTESDSERANRGNVRAALEAAERVRLSEAIAPSPTMPLPHPDMGTAKQEMKRSRSSTGQSKCPPKTSIGVRPRIVVALMACAPRCDRCGQFGLEDCPHTPRIETSSRVEAVGGVADPEGAPGRAVHDGRHRLRAGRPQPHREGPGSARRSETPAAIHGVVVDRMAT